MDFEEEDGKYEFNAPKFVDFTQVENIEVDASWFDQKEGDEGGIPLEFASEYEKIKAENGAVPIDFYEKALAASQIGSEIPDGVNDKSPEIIKEQIHESPSASAVEVPSECSSASVVDNPPMQSIQASTCSSGKDGEPSELHTETLEAEAAYEEARDTPMVGRKPESPKYAESDPVEEAPDSPMVVKKSEPAPESAMEQAGSAVIENAEMSGTAQAEGYSESPAMESANLPKEEENDESPETHRQQRKSSYPKSEKKRTPKTRFQPVRKSTSRRVDYNDKRKRVTSVDRTGCKKLKMDESAKAKKKHRSSVSLELATIRRLQRQTRRNVKRNAIIKNRVLAGKEYQPIRSIQATQTKEFSFMTSARMKKSLGESMKKEKEPKGYQNETTKPVPFNFTNVENPRATRGEWQSVAQATLEFQTKTPTRFHVKPSNEKFERRSILKPTRRSTRPQSPRLQSGLRVRSDKIEGAKDIEDKLVEEMKSYQFKATEFKQNIVDMKGMYGVKPVVAQSTTELKPFKRMEHSLAKYEARTKQMEDENGGIEKENVEKSVMLTETVVKPFTFDQRDQAMLRRKEERLQEESVKEKKEVKPEVRLKRTAVKPFTFDEKDKERYARKEQKIQETILNEKMLHNFYTEGMPSLSPEELPKVERKAPTKPKPFDISTGSSSLQNKLMAERKREEEEELLKKQFKAKPADVVKKEPFKPLTGVIPPTQPEAFNLNLEDRAHDRKAFEAQLAEKRKAEEEERLRQEKERELMELEQIKLLRQEAVHKANPVRTFKPVEIKKGLIPLTDAKTPNISKTRHVSRDGDIPTCGL